MGPIEVFSASGPDEDTPLLPNAEGTASFKVRAIESLQRQLVQLHETKRDTQPEPEWCSGKVNPAAAEPSAGGTSRPACPEKGSITGRNAADVAASGVELGGSE